MPPEIEVTTEDNQHTEKITTETESPSNSPSYVTADDLNKKFAEITETLNKAVNGIAKKFEKKLEEVNAQPKTGEQKELTIETLKSEYETKLKELQDKSQNELEAFKAQLAEKDRSEFISKVNSKISIEFANKGFDDVSAALDVFRAMHPEINYQPGTDGYIIYKNGEQSQTLEKLIDGWSKSAVGKRFLPAAPIPNGSGTKEKSSKNADKSGSDEGLSRTAKVLKKYS